MACGTRGGQVARPRGRLKEGVFCHPCTQTFHGLIQSDTHPRGGPMLDGCGWPRASRMGVTNLPIIGCHLGLDRPDSPSTALPNKTGQRLYVAQSRFIWSQIPESRFFLSPIPGDMNGRRTLGWDRSRIRSEENGSWEWTSDNGEEPPGPGSALARLSRACRDTKESLSASPTPESNSSLIGPAPDLRIPHVRIPARAAATTSDCIHIDYVPFAPPLLPLK
jgi:hypothetical protein